MRLIDAERLDKEGWILRRIVRSDGNSTTYEQMFPSYFPTVEAEPVKTGKWIYEHGYYCSKCGDFWAEDDREMIKIFNYCPNCGARMDPQ